MVLFSAASRIWGVSVSPRQATGSGNVTCVCLKQNTDFGAEVQVRNVLHDSN